MITFRGKKVASAASLSVSVPSHGLLHPHKINSHSRSTVETLTVSNCNLHNKHPQVFLQGRLALPLLKFRPLPHRPYEYEHHYRRSASQPCCIHCPVPIPLRISPRPHVPLELG